MRGVVYSLRFDKVSLLNSPKVITNVGPSAQNCAWIALQEVNGSHGVSPKIDTVRGGEEQFRQKPEGYTAHY